MTHNPKLEFKNKQVLFSIEMLYKLAPKIGAIINIEPEYGFAGKITYKNGKVVFFKLNHFSINSFGHIEITKDKGYSKFFLEQNGFSVPKGQTFFSRKLNKLLSLKKTIDDGYKYAEQIGFPLIVKPNNLSQGVLVCKIHNKEEYYNIAKRIFKMTDVLIIEELCYGNDYRIVILDGECFFAYKRIPLNITGNGKNTVKELLEQKHQELINCGRGKKIDYNDFRIIGKLQNQNINFDSIIEDGKNIKLLDNANLSTGGDVIDFSESIHDDYKNLAINITKSMGLGLCGVDIMTDDITKPLSEYKIIEINGSPSIDNYINSEGANYEKIESFYFKILTTMGK